MGATCAGFVRAPPPNAPLTVAEPMESDLSRQVEYDMDEDGACSAQPCAPLLTGADQAWLDSVNDQRNQAKLPVVSYEILEVLLDRLEKEWFDLVSSPPRPTF